MKHTRFLFVFVLVLALTVFSGCGALAALDRAEDVIENRMDAAEDAIENKVDAAEDALEQKVNEAANALLGPDTATGNFTPADPSQLITHEQAQEIALEHAGVDGADAVGLHTELQIDDGRQEYEVLFRVGHIEYEYEIDAVNGTIVSYDRDD